MDVTESTEGSGCSLPGRLMSFVVGELLMPRKQLWHRRRKLANAPNKFHHS
jgi:hypothetical protein